LLHNWTDVGVLCCLLQLHIMLDLKGHLKLCHPMEALASDQQRHVFRDEMIPGAQRWRCQVDTR
jgi:hypothetical protein